MKTTEDINAVLIAGPTASGKSDIGIALAERFNGTIINSDAMQVYRGLRILTARPSEADEARVPHRLYGEVEPDIAWSVADWAKAATQIAHEVVAEGRLPIFLGGTGMYLSVLSEGITPMPEIPGEIRADVRSRVPEELFGQVCAVDPELANRVGPGDPQRLMRALEVFLATGDPLSQWQERPKVRPFEGKFASLVIEPDRAFVYERIEQRFDRMMEEGAMAEIAELAARDLPKDLPIMRALGVPELLRVHCGEMELDDAIPQIKTKTRRFAKRQLTWFRNQMMSWDRVSTQDMESMKQEIFNIILDSSLTLPK